MKGIYRLNVDYGRDGSLTGIFVEEDFMVEALIESKISVYFGEALGKHSEVYGAIEASEITLLTASSEAVRVVETYNLENGYNPFNKSVATGDDLPELIKEYEQDDWHVYEAVKLYIERKNVSTTR